MKAMILAAGLGTRLRPFTDNKPKALVELGGRTLLEITLARLRTLGVSQVIVNVHHFRDLVEDYLRANANFGLQIELSREDTLLDTGGGLKEAAWFFRAGGDQEPFFLHNVDVISRIDLAQMLAEHRRTGALATLAVQARKSSRQLLFDQEGPPCGRRRRGVGEGRGKPRAAGFCRYPCDFAAAARADDRKRSLFDYRYLSQARWCRRKDPGVPRGSVLLARSGQAAEPRASGT